MAWFLNPPLKIRNVRGSIFLNIALSNYCNISELACLDFRYLLLIQIAYPLITMGLKQPEYAEHWLATVFGWKASYTALKVIEEVQIRELNNVNSDSE